MQFRPLNQYIITENVIFMGGKFDLVKASAEGNSDLVPIPAKCKRQAHLDHRSGQTVVMLGITNNVGEYSTDSKYVSADSFLHQCPLRSLFLTRL